MTDGLTPAQAAGFQRVDVTVDGRDVAERIVARYEERDFAADLEALLRSDLIEVIDDVDHEASDVARRVWPTVKGQIVIAESASQSSEKRQD